MKESFRWACGGGRRRRCPVVGAPSIVGIVWTMVPLASATALGIIGGTISVSLLCIWWLLRAERQETDEEEAAAAESGEPLAGREANRHH